MLANITRALLAVPRVFRRPAEKRFPRNFAEDIGVVGLVVQEILPRETIGMMNAVAFEPGDPSAKSWRSYVQAIAVEMAADADWAPLYDQAMSPEGGLNPTDRGLLVRAVLEMQGRDLGLVA